MIPQRARAGERSRNDLLDGMRGVAALAVVIFHIGGILNNSWAPAGYLAVDYFFVLSGLVLGLAYDRRLAAGLSFGRFMTMRVIRLYPVFALGIALGIAKSIAQIALHQEQAMGLSELVVAIGLNLFMLPVPFHDTQLFPLNTPAWSLMAEFVINIAYASVLFRARTPVLVLIAVLAGLGVVVAALSVGHLNVGSDRAHVLFGLFRVAFSFPLGMLMARMLRDRQRRPTRAAYALLAALGAVLLLPVPAGLVTARDLVFVFVVSPGIVWIGATIDVPPRWRRPLAMLGDLSYPVYALHYPLLLGAIFVLTRLHLPDPVVAFGCLLIVATAAWLAGHYFDRPIRRALSARLMLRESAAPQVV